MNEPQKSGPPGVAGETKIVYGHMVKKQAIKYFQASMGWVLCKARIF